MNKSQLKSYAPQARKDFIAAVTARANLLGLSEQGGQLEVAPAQTQGDVTLIAGQAWPAKLMGQRDKLIARIRKEGFAQTLEAVAYTWFNRFAALRYMELHDYLGHGYRALSSREPGGLPEILAHATDLVQGGSAAALPGLQPHLVTELKLAGNRDGELYRLLLVAQCNALSTAMPFLFERIDDETELLLPDNLLRTDSVIADLVNSIDEQDWQEVEIIGWLYQFYISEKKDQVIGKVVKSEDIPAATQLFTPNWIVQYLVQNSVGRLWLMANPQSTLAKEWPYYITPAEQTPEVQAQLDALIQTRVREDGDALNPESITVLDPACGSGHILVVAYDVLKAIYLERGYQPRSIPRLILEKNLYGLDIDDRAAQMAGFALLMKARADDRRLFTATDEAGNLQPPKLNVLSLQESKGLSVDELATHLAPFKVQRATINALVDAFEHAKTFGSLIQIPYALKTHLPLLPEILTLVRKEGDMYAAAAADDLLPLAQQAQILAMKFDAVVANPPYMGGKHMNPAVKDFLKQNYSGFEKDVFSAFMKNSLDMTRPAGSAGFMSPFVWMFISSYENLRDEFVMRASISSLVQLEYSGFDGATVPVCTFVLAKSHIPDLMGDYIRLAEFRGADLQGPKTLEAIQNPDCDWRYVVKSDAFGKLPGSPIAYWVSDNLRETFALGRQLSDLAKTCVGLQTGENAIFVRCWHEVDMERIGLNRTSRGDALASGKKWFPYNKGGDFRRWYGNQYFVVDWESDGARLYAQTPKSVIRNPDTYFRPSVSWSKISSSMPAFRYFQEGFIYDVAGTSLFAGDGDLQNRILGFCNSIVARRLLEALSPTLNFEVGQISSLPIQEAAGDASLVSRLIEVSREDWDQHETSWNFATHPLIPLASQGALLKSTYNSLRESWRSKTVEMQSLEHANNKAFIDAFRLGDEIESAVSINQISLFCNPSHRYSESNDVEASEGLLLTDSMKELISYAVGCMMGRFCLDEPGLIYAHAGNVGFEPGRYATFPADADGIVPITDELWFADDACTRVREFLRAVWGTDTLEENMAWLAESLGAKTSETPDETIRRYLADKFFKDHLQTYKKRPIYWLFSSGKQGAFQALVYLHRYNEGTLARMRAEYVVPLTGKLQTRIEMLSKDAQAATSTAARNKLNKEVEKLNKKHVELLAFDEKLRHYADMRISLDLDDGVKVNYGKFGDLLAEVKAVTGGSADE